jgi:hypothetical protein
VISLGRDGKVDQNTVYYDGAAFARQIGMLPRQGRPTARSLPRSTRPPTPRHAFGIGAGERAGLLCSQTGQHGPASLGLRDEQASGSPRRGPRSSQSKSAGEAGRIANAAVQPSRRLSRDRQVRAQPQTLSHAVTIGANEGADRPDSDARSERRRSRRSCGSRPSVRSGPRVSER